MNAWDSWALIIVAGVVLWQVIVRWPGGSPAEWWDDAPETGGGRTGGLTATTTVPAAAVYDWAADGDWAA